MKKYKELSQKKTSYIQTDTENRKDIPLENKNESDLTNSLGHQKCEFSTYSFYGDNSFEL